MDVVVESNILEFHVYKDVCMDRRFLFVKWRTSIHLSPRFCDLLDAATFNALLIKFCTSISFTDRFDEVPLA